MRELSLFSGAGGGLLGTMLLGWRPVGYVEKDEYCQRVIAQRIADGILPGAPIFGDIRAFNSEGYAAAYTGLVDVITAGFPCQPFSEIGRRNGADDERNMWPVTIECIRLVRPRFSFLENVPGLLTSGYFSRILGDLAESGLDCRWRVLSAAEMGAPHKRDRLWIVAYPAGCIRSPQRRSRQHGAAKGRPQGRSTNSSEDVSNAQGESLGSARQPRQDAPRSGWWSSEPGLDRVVNGMADRMERIKALGNGQVACVAATAWHLLTQDLEINL